MNYELWKEVSKGTILGLAIFFVVVVLGLPLPLLSAAPLLAGIVVGKTRRGLLSGFLTALIPILIIIAILVGALVSYDPSSQLPSSVTLSGNPFGAVAQAIFVAVVGSSAVGIGALFLIMALVLIIVGSVVALLLSAGLGALGGLIGGRIRTPRVVSGEPGVESSHGGGEPTLPEANRNRD